MQLCWRQYLLFMVIKTRRDVFIRSQCELFHGRMNHDILHTNRSTTKLVAANYSVTSAAFRHATDDYVTTATTTSCRNAVTVWMCFTNWVPGGCLNRVLSPACSECFSLTGDGACHFAYFGALVLLISSVRCIDNVFWFNYFVEGCGEKINYASI